MPKEQTIADVLNPSYATRMSKGEDLKVELKKNFKGTSLYAKKPFRKGNVIAYYKFKIFSQKNFRGKKGDMYVMSVYTKTGRYNHRVIGDIFNGSLQPPTRGISYWAYFSNEPSADQKENCYLDINLKSNYRNRDSVRAGDTMIYKLRASRDIKKGEEICWCYGGAYHRSYKANCE